MGVSWRWGGRWVQLGPGRTVPGPCVIEIAAVVSAEQDDLMLRAVVDQVGVVPRRGRGRRVQPGPCAAVPDPGAGQVAATGSWRHAAAEQQQLAGGTVK